MIQFTTDILNSNPAYNDSIIRYNSTMTGMTKSEIYISGTSAPFTVYPFNQTFSFNFKDIAKVLINPNGFRDTIIPNLTSGDFIVDDPNLQFTLSATVTTLNATTGDSTSVTYKFTKNVEQLPFYYQKSQIASDVVLLLPTQNNFDYSVTYFEGFPFDFSIRGLEAGDEFYFANTNTGLISSTFTATTSEVKRIFLSDGATNETIDNVLMLYSSTNSIELWVNGVIKANLNIKKIESNCGLYLKWFNQYGSYSYWLFDNVYKENLKTKDLADIQGKWENLQSLYSTSESLGKTATSSLQLNTTFNNTEKDYLVDIVKSPKVEMFINQMPFSQQTDFDFLGVKVSDQGFNFENKTTLNKLGITVELPAINTITY
jgi:hypothetical protein